MQLKRCGLNLDQLFVFFAYAGMWTLKNHNLILDWYTRWPEMSEFVTAAKQIVPSTIQINFVRFIAYKLIRIHSNIRERMIDQSIDWNSIDRNERGG